MMDFMMEPPGPPRKAVKGIKSWYYDPFKWGIVKSVLLFGFGVMVARELKGIDVAANIAGGASHPLPM